MYGRGVIYAKSGLRGLRGAFWASGGVSVRGIHINSVIPKIIYLIYFPMG